jgi:hypothetical protein
VVPEIADARLAKPRAAAEIALENFMVLVLVAGWKMTE